MGYTFSEIRKGVREMNSVICMSPKWLHHYRVDRLRADDYFFQLDNWKKKIIDFAATMHSSKQCVVHLDICGNTSARMLGYDHSYQFSMSTRGALREDCTACRGDIFDKRALRGFLKNIESERGKLSFTTFMPMAGLQSHTPMKDCVSHRDVLYRRLFQQLTLVMLHTHVGGYILLERPFQLDFDDGRISDFLSRTPFEQNAFHINLKAWGKMLNCSVKGIDTCTGGYWLLRKN